jgi:hypothetical protein
MDPNEIGKQIKQKYPQYAQYPDAEVGQKYISKYGNKQVSQEVGQAGQTSQEVSGNYADLIKKYFPQDQWKNAYKVMLGESGGRADAVGDNYPIKGLLAPSYGLFQIRALPGRPAPDQLTDAEFNIKYAADLYKAQGWRPWTAARKLGLVK